MGRTKTCVLNGLKRYGEQTMTGARGVVGGDTGYTKSGGYKDLISLLLMTAEEDKKAGAYYVFLRPGRNENPFVGQENTPVTPQGSVGEVVWGGGVRLGGPLATLRGDGL